LQEDFGVDDIDVCAVEEAPQAKSVSSGVPPDHEPSDFTTVEPFKARVGCDTTEWMFGFAIEGVQMYTNDELKTEAPHQQREMKGFVMLVKALKVTDFATVNPLGLSLIHIW
jgi:hypothetical protein